MKEIMFELAGKQIGVLGGDACRVSDNLNENTFDGWYANNRLDEFFKKVK